MQENPDNGVLAYFYCNRNEESRRYPIKILHSFIRQLSTSVDKEAVPYLLMDAYRKKEENAFASNSFDYAEAEELLLQLIQTYPKTVLVLDALDECCEGLRTNLIKTLNDFVENVPQLKVFISSRRDGDIKYQLGRSDNLGIEATDNQDDIARFVNHTIQMDQRSRRIPLSDELHSQIVQTLLQGSQGMQVQSTRFSLR